MVTWRVWEHVLCLWPTLCRLTHHPGLSLNRGISRGWEPIHKGQALLGYTYSFI